MGKKGVDTMDKIMMERELSRLFADKTLAARLLHELEDRFYIIVFGGAVRDIVYGKMYNIRDIDLVIYPIDERDYKNQDNILDSIIRKNYRNFYQMNRFGGYKIIGCDINIDIWLLKNTWAFKQKILPVSTENLLKSVYLNVDAYAWDYNRKFFLSESRPSNKAIDIVLEENPCEYLNLIRAVQFSYKYDMEISDQIKEKLVKMLDDWAKVKKEVYSAENKHYGKRLVTKQRIYEVLEDKNGNN